MGRPMAEALARAGYDPRGYDVKPANTFSEFAPKMRSLADFCDGLQILISVVRDIPQTEDVLFGAQNIVENAPDLSHIVISSTLSPRYVRELRSRIPAEIALIDAPMSGAAIAAKEARLSFMLGGEPETLNQLEPMFSAMGTHLHRTGPFGTGMAVKVLNNLVAASSVVTTRLALDWADAQGIDEETLLKVMRDSSGQTWFGSNFSTIEFARDGLTADNSIGILKKDLESALDAAPGHSDTTLPRALIEAIAALKPRP